MFGFSRLRSRSESKPVNPNNDTFVISSEAEKATEVEVASGRSRDSNEKRVLTPADAPHVLADSWSTTRKWTILTAVFIVQCSMNFNAAIYANAVGGIADQFALSNFMSRIGQFAFLISYAFGCELWAPFSEEFGRFPIMQISLWLVTLSQLPCALAPNYGTILFGRIMGGLCSAGGSVTLGIVADLYGRAWHQWALLFIVFASCGGSVLAPPTGGYLETFLSWQWVFWVSMIFSGVSAALHFFMARETRPESLLDKEAQRLRKTGQDLMVWGPFEVHGHWYQRLEFTRITKLMWRPYKMLLTEPIVACLSLLSGFSDALIFTGLNSVGMVLGRWNFSKIEVGWSFIALLIGYAVGSASFIPFIRKDRRDMNGDPYAIKPEQRMRNLLWTAPLMPIGLLGFAWTSLGPDAGVSWFGPVFFMFVIGVANVAIYMATIDYMVEAYGSEYSASATGGNGFCRDALAGFAALYATPLYTNIAHGSELQFAWPTMILFGIGLVLVVPVYVFYFKGEWVRSRSKIAKEVQRKRDAESDRGHGNIEQVGATM